MEAPTTRSKRKYVKKTENGSKMETKKRKAVVTEEAESRKQSHGMKKTENVRKIEVKEERAVKSKKSAENVNKIKKIKEAVKPKKSDDKVKSDGSDEEMEGENSNTVSDAMKNTENVCKIKNKKKRAVNPKKAGDQIKSPTDDKVKYGGSSSSDEETGDESSDAVNKIKKMREAIKPKKSDGSEQSENSNTVVSDAEYVCKVENQMKRAVKRKKAGDQMKSECTPTDNKVKYDGSPSSHQESGDENSDAVNKIKMKKAEKPKKSDHKVKSDGSPSTNEEMEGEIPDTDDHHKVNYDESSSSDEETGDESSDAVNKIKKMREAIKPKKSDAQAKSDGSEEGENSNTVVSDAENVCKIENQMKRAVKPKKADDQIKSECTPTDHKVKYDGSSSSHQESGDENSDAVNKIEMKEAEKPKKSDHKMKFDGSSSTNEETGGEIPDTDAIKKTEKVRKIEKNKKRAAKPKKADDQMKSECTPTDDKVKNDGSSSFDEETRDENSDAVSDAIKKTEKVAKIEKDKKRAVNPKKVDEIKSGSTQTDAGQKLDRQDSVHVDNDDVVTILHRMEAKLEGIAREHGTEIRFFSILVRMPYNCRKDIILYNGELMDSELFLKFATYFESVGGINDGKIVCNMLHQIATPHLLSQFDWRDTSETSFQVLKNVIKVIHVAATKTCSNKYNLALCGEIIKTALRNARGGSKN